MSALSIVALAAGIVALVAGAEWLVRGAARIAARTGMSNVVIGLTVVAFGTSAPELAVSVGDVLRGDESAGEIAIGNVIGSNVANILLALGIAAAVGGALVVASRIVWIDVPLMIGASMLLLLFALDEGLGRVEGLILSVLLVVYLVWTVVAARRETDGTVDDLGVDLSDAALGAHSVWHDIGIAVAGLAFLVGGSQSLVWAASDIAADLGVSDLLIGLTVVAVGTSLPEVATSVVAALRGERDLAVGNAVGSNLFNLLAVLGITAAIAPDPLPIAQSALQVDLPVMIVVAVACLPIFANGHVLERWEGALFFLFYIGYIAWLILDATEHDARDSYGSTMLFFVLPLTAITLVVLGLRARRPTTA